MSALHATKFAPQRASESMTKNGHGLVPETSSGHVEKTRFIAAVADYKARTGAKSQDVADELGLTIHQLQNALKRDDSRPVHRALVQAAEALALKVAAPISDQEIASRARALAIARARWSEVEELLKAGAA